MGDDWISKEELMDLMKDRELSKFNESGGLSKLLQYVHSSERGIDSGSVEERELKYDKNELRKVKSKSFLRLWAESFCDTTLIILIVLACVALIIAFVVEKGQHLSWLDGTAILITVLAVTLIGTFNTWSQERQFQKLNERQKDREVIVTRDGQPVQISIFRLVVGDILKVSTGDILPVDGIVLEANDIQCDEAAMTGESDLIKKSLEKNPFMLSGCKVQTGFGRMVVICVGMNTQFGILKGAILSAAEERHETPLQQKLGKLAKLIGYIGFIAAGITLVLLVIFWVIALVKGGKEKWGGGKYLLDLVDAFIIAVTIIVMAVPEGLPLAVTLSLAYSMKQMLKDNNLVRRLESCETMGGATTICSDKTGTLTQNKMRVVAGFFNGVFRTNVQIDNMDQGDTSTEASASSSPSFLHPPIPKPYQDDLFEAVSVNSSADLKPSEKQRGKYDYLGNVTECAMLLFAHERKYEYAEIRKRQPLCQTIPFSSERKRMTVVIKKGKSVDGVGKRKGKGGRDLEGAKGLEEEEIYSSYRVITKGASEIVLGYCTHYFTDDENGGTERLEITPERRTALEKIIHSMAVEGLRTIGISFKDVSWEDLLESRKDVLRRVEEAQTRLKQQKKEDAHPDLVRISNAELNALFPLSEDAESLQTLIGIVGIKDPLRPEVPEAIQDCRSANIVVRMVTGDNIDTAMNIAKECGIYVPSKGIAMEGVIFRSLPEEERERILPKLQVLARSSPIDKQILVGGLQKLTHVVAVTGDGTNDAPALSKADVGFAMGITGTEVAKDAAAITITDDNFASIVKAVMWGRNVYDCIRKFLQFQLTVNFSAMSVAVVGAVFTIIPLKAVPMLWVNLIMDTLAALSLATERPTRRLLNRNPYGRSDPIICWSMWRNIIGGAVYEALVLIALLFLWGDNIPKSTDLYKRCIDPNDARYVSVNEVFFPEPLCRKYALDSNVVTFSKQHYAFIFNTFIWMQLFNLFMSRKCYNEINFFYNLSSNWLFFVVWIICAVCQVIIMLVPGIRLVFSVDPLITWIQWLYSFLFSFLIVPWKFILHLIKTPSPFAGAIKIKKDPGAPAGVYRQNYPIPDGCELSSLLGKDDEPKVNN